MGCRRISAAAPAGSWVQLRNLEGWTHSILPLMEIEDPVRPGGSDNIPCPIPPPSLLPHPLPAGAAGALFPQSPSIN